MEGAIVENGHGNVVIANVHVNNSDHNINDKWIPAPKETFSPQDMNSLPRANKSEPGTGLLRAARAGNLEKVLEYLKAGVDINTCNANGLNALHLASKDGHVNVVAELLERGANVDAATKKGNTALHIAALAGQEEVVRLLVQNGANVNVQSAGFFSPCYMAAQENHDGVVRYLLANGANQSLATEDGFTPLAVAMQQGHDKVVALLLESDVRGKVRLPALHIAAKKDDCKAASLLLQNSANPDVTSKSFFTPLHIAAHYGNHAVAALLLDRGADVNFPAKHQITPLHVASKWGKSQLAALLLERGANIEAKTRDCLSPLHCAARSGHEQLVDLLLEKGAPISAKTKNGLSPLHMSAQGDHVDAARILLYHKAPVDDVTIDYLTALHVASHCGHVRVAKLLLDRKADPNARALNGFSPLHIACKKNRIKVVELLLKNGAHIEATTESGLTPLHVASFMGCMNIAIFLLQNGAKPDAATVRGETPLHLAARANQTDVVRILLRNGATVDARAREDQTPLHVASRLGNCDLVMLLLQHGASTDASTREHYNALHIAAKEGQEEVASILLDKGANVAAVTKRSFTPLHLASKYGHLKVANLLISKGAPVNAEGKANLSPLHMATHHDRNQVALMLLNNGADPKCTAKNGYTPLHIAAKKNQIDIATALLEYGAEINAESRAGFSPIHLAAQEGNADMVTLLLQHGANADAGAKSGLRPLHLAAQEDRVQAANVLVSNGSAPIDSQTGTGYTPLHVASHFGQAAMVRYLLQHGADVHSTTSAGNSPLHHAAQQGQTLIITLLLEKKANPDAVNNLQQTPLAIAEKLGYVSVVETLKIVTTTITTTTTTTTTIEERYKVLAPESMAENLASDSEDEGTEDTGNESYRYLTVDDMKSLKDDSLPIDVTRDEQHHRDSGYLNTEENIISQKYSQLASDNVDISRSPVQIGIPSADSYKSLTISPTPTPSARYSLNYSIQSRSSTLSTSTIGMCRDSFLVSFMVDARGGAMRGCRHSGVRVIIPPRKAPSPMRITCRYLKKDRLVHPPPLMEGEALASRILELGPAGAKFLGPVILEVPHFASVRGHEREIVVLRSDNGETWREHNLDATEEAVQDVLNESFDTTDLKQLEDLKTSRITRILTTDFPQYFALVSRIRQEVHAVGPEGGMVSSSVVPQVQAVFPCGALTKRIKVGLQAQPIATELINKVAGSRVSVSPIVTVEPRRRKFHKPITLTIPVPKSQDPNSSLRLLCSITGGTTRAQWEDVTGSTPLTFVNDCVSFTTTVSARFWLVDCRHASHDVTRMATDLYREAIHVPFMAKFVIFSKRIEPTEARLRVFCMTDDREEKTLEGQENFTEVAKSRDVEVLEGKPQWVELAGNLAPVTKSGEQLRLKFYAFKENRLPFLVRLRDPNSDPVGRIIFMRESKSSGKSEQVPVCNLNIVLPDQILPDEPSAPPSMSSSPRLPLHTNRYNIRNAAYSSTPKQSLLTVGPGEIHKADLKISDVANLLGNDWVPLAHQLGIADQDVAIIEAEYPQSPHQQATVMLRLWMQQAGDRATGNSLEKSLRNIGRDDIVSKCIGNVAPVTDASEKIIAQTHVDQAIKALGSQIIQPALIKQEKRNLSLDESSCISKDEQDIMKDSESLEELSQTESFKVKSQRMKSPTDENVFDANSMMTSYEREEQKYVAEEKVCSQKVHWDDPEDGSRPRSVDRSDMSKSEDSMGTPEKTKTEKEEGMTETESQSYFYDTGISMTLTKEDKNVGMMSDTEGEVSDLSLTSPKKDSSRFAASRSVDDISSDDLLQPVGDESFDTEDATFVVPSPPESSVTITADEPRIEIELDLDSQFPQQQEQQQQAHVELVDKACSPVIGTPERPETISRSQQISFEAKDVGVGTSPKEYDSKDVLTQLHDIVNVPIEDEEIYKTLKEQVEQRLKNETEEKTREGAKVARSTVIDVPEPKDLPSERSPPTVTKTPIRGLSERDRVRSTSIDNEPDDNDDMLFDLSIEDEPKTVPATSSSGREGDGTHEKSQNEGKVEPLPTSTTTFPEKIEEKLISPKFTDTGSITKDKTDVVMAHDIRVQVPEMKVTGITTELSKDSVIQSKTDDDLEKMVVIPTPETSQGATPTAIPSVIKSGDGGVITVHDDSTGFDKIQTAKTKLDSIILDIQTGDVVQSTESILDESPDSEKKDLVPEKPFRIKKDTKAEPKALSSKFTVEPVREIEIFTDSPTVVEEEEQAKSPGGRSIFKIKPVDRKSSGEATVILRDDPAEFTTKSEMKAEKRDSSPHTFPDDDEKSKQVVGGEGVFIESEQVGGIPSEISSLDVDSDRQLTEKEKEKDLEELVEFKAVKADDNLGELIQAYQESKKSALATTLKTFESLAADFTSELQTSFNEKTVVTDSSVIPSSKIGVVADESKRSEEERALKPEKTVVAETFNLDKVEKDIPINVEMLKPSLEIKTEHHVVDCVHPTKDNVPEEPSKEGKVDTGIIELPLATSLKDDKISTTTMVEKKLESFTKEDKVSETTMIPPAANVHKVQDVTSDAGTKNEQLDIEQTDSPPISLESIVRLDESRLLSYQQKLQTTLVKERLAETEKVFQDVAESLDVVKKTSMDKLDDVKEGDKETKGEMRLEVSPPQQHQQQQQQQSIGQPDMEFELEDSLSEDILAQPYLPQSSQFVGSKIIGEHEDFVQTSDFGGKLASAASEIQEKVFYKHQDLHSELSRDSDSQFSELITGIDVESELSMLIEPSKNEITREILDSKSEHVEPEVVEIVQKSVVVTKKSILPEPTPIDDDALKAVQEEANLSTVVKPAETLTLDSKEKSDSLKESKETDVASTNVVKDSTFVKHTEAQPISELFDETVLTMKDEKPKVTEVVVVDIDSITTPLFVVGTTEYSDIQKEVDTTIGKIKAEEMVVSEKVAEIGVETNKKVVDKMEKQESKEFVNVCTDASKKDSIPETQSDAEKPDGQKDRTVDNLNKFEESFLERADSRVVEEPKGDSTTTTTATKSVVQDTLVQSIPEKLVEVEASFKKDKPTMSSPEKPSAADETRVPATEMSKRDEKIEIDDTKSKGAHSVTLDEISVVFKGIEKSEETTSIKSTPSEKSVVVSATPFDKEREHSHEVTESVAKSTKKSDEVSEMLATSKEYKVIEDKPDKVKLKSSESSEDSKVTSLLSAIGMAGAAAAIYVKDLVSSEELQAPEEKQINLDKEITLAPSAHNIHDFEASQSEQSRQQEISEIDAFNLKSDENGKLEQIVEEILDDDEIQTSVDDEIAALESIVYGGGSMHRLDERGIMEQSLPPEFFDVEGESLDAKRGIGVSPLSDQQSGKRKDSKSLPTVIQEEETIKPVSAIKTEYSCFDTTKKEKVPDSRQLEDVLSELEAGVLEFEGEAQVTTEKSTSLESKSNVKDDVIEGEFEATVHPQKTWVTVDKDIFPDSVEHVTELKGEEKSKALTKILDDMSSEEEKNKEIQKKATVEREEQDDVIGSTSKDKMPVTEELIVPIVLEERKPEDVRKTFDYVRVGDDREEKLSALEEKAMEIERELEKLIASTAETTEKTYADFTEVHGKVSVQDFKDETALAFDEQWEEQKETDDSITSKSTDMRTSECDSFDLPVDSLDKISKADTVDMEEEESTKVEKSTQEVELEINKGDAAITAMDVGVEMQKSVPGAETEKVTTGANISPLSILKDVQDSTSKDLAKQTMSDPEEFTSKRSLPIKLDELKSPEGESKIPIFVKSRPKTPETVKVKASSPAPDIVTTELPKTKPESPEPQIAKFESPERISSVSLTGTTTIEPFEPLSTDNVTVKSCSVPEPLKFDSKIPVPIKTDSKSPEPCSPKSLSPVSLVSKKPISFQLESAAKVSSDQRYDEVKSPGSPRESKIPVPIRSPVSIKSGRFSPPSSSSSPLLKSKKDSGDLDMAQTKDKSTEREEPPPSSHFTAPKQMPLLVGTKEHPSELDLHVQTTKEDRDDKFEVADVPPTTSMSGSLAAQSKRETPTAEELITAVEKIKLASYEDQIQPQTKSPASSDTDIISPGQVLSPSTADYSSAKSRSPGGDGSSSVVTASPGLDEFFPPRGATPVQREVSSPTPFTDELNPRLDKEPSPSDMSPVKSKSVSPTIVEYLPSNKTTLVDVKLDKAVASNLKIDVDTIVAEEPLTKTVADSFKKEQIKSAFEQLESIESTQTEKLEKEKSLETEKAKPPIKGELIRQAESLATSMAFETAESMEEVDGFQSDDISMKLPQSVVVQVKEDADNEKPKDLDANLIDNEATSIKSEPLSEEEPCTTVSLPQISQSDDVPRSFLLRRASESTVDDEANTIDLNVVPDSRLSFSSSSSVVTVIENLSDGGSFGSLSYHHDEEDSKPESTEKSRVGTTPNVEPQIISVHDQMTKPKTATQTEAEKDETTSNVTAAAVEEPPVVVEKVERKKPGQLLSDVDRLVDEAREAASQLKREVKMLRPDLTPTPTDQAMTPVLKAMLGLLDVEDDKLETVIEEDKISDTVSPKKTATEALVAGGSTELTTDNEYISITEAEQGEQTQAQSIVADDTVQLAHFQSVSDKDITVDKDATDTSSQTPMPLRPEEKCGQDNSKSDFKQEIHFQEYSRSPRYPSPPSPQQTTTKFKVVTPVRSPTGEETVVTKEEELVHEIKVSYESGASEARSRVSPILERRFAPPEKIGKEIRDVDFKEVDTKGSEERVEVIEQVVQTVVVPTVASMPLKEKCENKVEDDQEEQEGSPTVREQKMTFAPEVVQVPQHIQVNVFDGSLSTSATEEHGVVQVESKSQEKDRVHDVDSVKVVQKEIRDQSHEHEVNFDEPLRRDSETSLDTARRSHSHGQSTPETCKRPPPFGPTKLMGKKHRSVYSMPDLEYQIQYPVIPRPQSAPAIITSEVFVKTLDFVYSQKNETQEGCPYQCAIEDLETKVSLGTSSSSSHSSSPAIHAQSSEKTDSSHLSEDRSLSTSPASGIISPPSPTGSSSQTASTNLTTVTEPGQEQELFSDSSEISASTQDFVLHEGIEISPELTPGSSFVGSPKSKSSESPEGIGSPGRIPKKSQSRSSTSDSPRRILSTKTSTASPPSAATTTTGTSSASSTSSSRSASAVFTSKSPSIDSAGSKRSSRSTSEASSKSSRSNEKKYPYGSPAESRKTSSSVSDEGGATASPSLSASGSEAHSRSSCASSPLSISIESQTSDSTELQVTRLSPPIRETPGHYQYPTVVENLAPFIEFNFSVKERDNLQTQLAAEAAEDQSASSLQTGDVRRMEQVTASPSRVVDSVGSFDERKAFWVEKDLEEKKKRDSVASSVSIEDYQEGIENTAFMGVEKIDSTTTSGGVRSTTTTTTTSGSIGGPRTSISDTREEKLVPLRTPSPYEIERTKEAIFLDTDDVDDDDDVDQDTRIEVEAQIKKQILQAHLSESEGLEESSPERKVIFSGSRQSASSSSGEEKTRQAPIPPSIDSKQQSTRQVFEVEEEITFREEFKEAGQHGVSSTTVTKTETRVKTTTLEKSEFETSEKQHADSSKFYAIDPSQQRHSQQQRRHSPDFDDEDEEQVVRQAASSLVSEIESKVEEKMRTTSASSSTFARGDSGSDNSRPTTTTTSKTHPTQISTKISDSSVDITDEELLSTGDASSPEPLKHHLQSDSGERRGDVTLGTAGDSSAGGGAGTPEAHTVRSSSSGEFYTAREDGGLRSSSDDPTRPKSWDSSLLGQVSTNASGSCGSEYQTALSAASAASSSESYLGSLSSDASASETLVASQISLGRSLLQDDDDEDGSVETEGRRRGSREYSSSYQYEQDDVPPPLPPRMTITTSTTSTTTTDSNVAASRSVHCEAGDIADRNVTGLPVTLTSSTSGTTVCTQVETTYEARVRGDPEIADDQEGNIMVLEQTSGGNISINGTSCSSSTSRPLVRTHRRVESQSWNDSLLYGIEEKIEDEQLKDIVFPVDDIDEISDLFLNQCDDLDDPIERPVTPEPGYSPQGEEKRKRIVYYPGSSFDQSKDSLDDGDDPTLPLPPSSLPTDFNVEPCGGYERSLAMPRLEDIEEEGSLKNSPKSVLSLEMGSLDERNGGFGGSNGNGNGNGNGEKPLRPASRESSSSLNEFERLESAVEEEESSQDKKDETVLSEIEEGHESQVSEESDETEMCGDPDPYDADEDNDDKLMKIFSEKFEMVEDSPEITEVPEYAEDPMTYFSTTIEPRSPEALTNTDTSSQWDDPTLCKSELIGTTSADSSLEFRVPDRLPKVSVGQSSSTTTTTTTTTTSSKTGSDFNFDLNAKMTSSGDSLDEQKNLMEVSKDSLEFDENDCEQDPHDPPSSTINTSSSTLLGKDNQMIRSSTERNVMIDSLTGTTIPAVESTTMTDSLELASGQTSQQHMMGIMGESVDSLTGKSSDEKSGEAGVMITSTDSLDGPPGPSSSSATTADAAMWSSGTGSAATLVSSQEDLTLENQF